MQTTDQSITQARILLVDDVADNLFLLSLYLKSAGAEILTAESGRQALSLIALNNFDLIILDIQMPYMDGWELARLVRDGGFTGSIVACSAIGLDQEAFYKININFDAYLQKPVMRTDLLQCVRRQTETSYYLD